MSVHPFPVQTVRPLEPTPQSGMVILYLAFAISGGLVALLASLIF